MPTDLRLRCACGAVRGAVRDVSARSGNRIVCYCDDCQTFAHFLRAADRTLDARGGSEIFQTSSGRLAFSGGSDRLACIRLRPGGLVRWYASCCRTPLGNTLATRQVPFVGLIHSAFDPATEGRAREALLGPVRARVYTRFARRDGAEPAGTQGVPATALLRFLRLVILARLRGDHRRSPFFDPATGAPIALPHVLGDDELRRAQAARDAP